MEYLSLFLAETVSNNVAFFADKTEKQGVFQMSYFAAFVVVALIIIILIFMKIVSSHDKTNHLEKIMVHEIMDKNYPAIEKDTTLKQAYDLMKDNNINSLPVIKLNRVIGIIKKTTIERKLNTGDIISLETTSVATLLSRNATLLSKTDNLQAALKLMEEKETDTIIVIGPQNYYYGAVAKKRLLEYK